MSKFAGMKSQAAAKSAPAASSTAAEAAPIAARASGPTATRQGKKAISAYFPPEVSQGLHMLALEQQTTLQALMGEAFDLLMRQYGKHPFGER